MGEPSAVLVGELLLRMLRSTATDSVAWGAGDLSAAAGHLAELGLEAAAAARLLKNGSPNGTYAWAAALRDTYQLDRRELDRALRIAGFTTAERRAALGLPPE